MNLNTIFWYVETENVIHPFHIRNGIHVTLPNGKVIDADKAINTSMIVDVDGNIDIVPTITKFNLPKNWLIWDENVNVGQLYFNDYIDLQTLNDMKQYINKHNRHWMVNSGNVIIPLKKPYPVDY